MVYKDINDYYLVDMVCENDDISYEILFNKYNPLIRKIASNFYQNYSDYGYDYDDFVQEGYLGFYKAIRKFNVNKSVLLYTFVSLCVNRQMISFVKKITFNYSNCVNLPIDEYEFLYFSRDDFYDEGLEYLIKEVIFETPIEYSMIFELRVNNFSFKEIECLLGVKYSNAEYRYKKLKDLLKKKIENY